MSKDNTFYFSHDYNARSDIKIRNLILKHGALGYGVYWMLIEDLYNNTNVLPLNYDLIAFDLRVDKNVIQSIINDFDLFIIDGDYFGSLSVQRRLDERNEKSRKARESIAKRWEKTKTDTNVLRPQNNRNTIKESKVKESKVKEIKESTTDVVDNTDDDFSKISNSKSSIKKTEPEKRKKSCAKKKK
ncbi:DUF4373 domain-containing protein [Flavobacterium agricola]|uniref:DUF4373 domain-containing protein n=1 Tax=Flavobacterium agricola TaxID=2870839 RepID=A0ABY6M0L1_9FLAO|nr:DUF4373 domain-containing protein [Flavobacterium agricola]UYW02088.1 DUF4373 domain-containing protein [Flavobacterium agricola]